MDKPTIVSYSEVFKWDTCHREYHYSFDLGLQPIDTSVPILTGNKGHKLLQSFYELLREGKTKEEAQIRVQHRAKQLIETASVTEVQALLTAWSLVDNYIRDTDFTAEAILVENRFLIPASVLSDETFDDNPIFHNIMIGFTPDVVFERAGDFLDVEDAKFTGRAWSKKKLNRFPQAKLYQIFLNHMGYKVSRSMIRFFNTTTGEISVVPYTLNGDETKTLIHDFLQGVLEVVLHRELPMFARNQARRTMNYTACQFCPFEFPCTLEAEGKDATRTLENLYEKRDYDYSK